MFMATIALIMNNPEFNALHLRNVKEKKIKRIKSIMKLCGKLAPLGGMPEMAWSIHLRKEYHSHKQRKSVHSIIVVYENWLIRRISKKARSTGCIYIRAPTRFVSKTGLHPLERRDEGMKGLRPVETWEGQPSWTVWRMRAG
jgi:hypothetical protein